MKALLDFVPLIIFYYLLKTVDPKDSNHPLLQLIDYTGGTNNNDILVATTGLILSMVIIYGGLFIHQKFKLEKQQWIILLITIVMGGITLALRDATYIKLKAILVNLAFASILIFSPYFAKDKKPLIQRLLDPILDLTPRGWLKLNFAWAGLFITTALLHIFFAFIFMNGKYWGEFTVFGDMILMISFMIAQFVILRKHLKLTEE